MGRTIRSQCCPPRRWPEESRGAPAGKRQVATVDQKETPNSRVSMFERAEHVAGENHAACEATDENEGYDGVIAGAPAA